MTKGKKYDYRVVPGKAGWSAEIIRRISRQKMVVSKSQDGFATEAEAQVWGEKELKEFSQNLNERNRKRAETRKPRK